MTADETTGRWLRVRQWARSWVPPALLLLAGLLVWEIWVRIADTPTWFLPKPTAIARTLLDDRGLLAHHTWVTTKEVLVGFAVALVAGVALATLLDASTVAKRAVYPVIVASQAIPIVALAPLLLVWFGYGLLPKVIVTALVAFFPIVVTTFDGLRSADAELLDLFRTMEATRAQRFAMVKAPSALPSLFSGARVGVSIAVIGAVFGEYVGANAGLGYLMNISSSRLLTARVFACIAILAVMAVMLFCSVVVIERLAMPWRRLGVRVMTSKE